MLKTFKRKSLQNALLITLLVFLLAVACLCAAACNKVSLTSITATYDGEDVFVGDVLDKSNVKVTALYSDNSEKDVSSYTLTYDFSASGDKTVVVRYTDNGVTKAASFTVTVKTVSVIAPTLTSISATYNGGEIYVGDTLNKSDFAVTANYDNGTTQTVTDFTLTYDFSTSGDKTVTVGYTNGVTTKTKDVAVTVKSVSVVDPTLTSITATYNGGNIEVGGKLSSADIAVTAYYSDGSSKTVTNFSVGGFSSTTAGSQKVTVSYTDGGETKNCFVDVTVIDGSSEIIANGNLSIHFLEFENQSTGDCIYIKAGDTDILIDAGSTTGSAKTIDNYIKKYCTDGVLEYVIATHAHTDHISGFVGTSSTPGILDRYRCENIIQFSLFNATSDLYKNFCSKVEAEKEEGANVYNANDCVKGLNGAQKVYDLTGDGSVTMEILEHKYYTEKSSEENNYSVCALITQGSNHYLFTGDLEASGERSLVELNPNLPEVVLYKAGHHGSSTSSSETLLQKIKPQYVCICCCAGNVEYLKIVPQDLSNSFPTQEFINRIAPYTDKVYVTTLGKIIWKSDGKGGEKWYNNGYESMNGNIVFSCVNGEISLNCTNNNIKLKDTDWFKTNRDCPAAWDQQESDGQA
ncbi:MAG: bacterial Ig-like domain-containing protein [Corallococcus sp.]|nr:bacterial Ig-like domain-containing protein [Bacillota bacterium]MCM1533147.1 bacterial Ig-like domain-containing protein [Corallococcus sp.]